MTHIIRGLLFACGCAAVVATAAPALAQMVVIGPYPYVGPYRPLRRPVSWPLRRSVRRLRLLVPSIWCRSRSKRSVGDVEDPELEKGLTPLDPAQRWA